MEEDRLPRRWVTAIVAGAVVLAVIVGYPVERHYLQNRYRDPSFTTPGLDAAFAWARGVSDSRIATTSTRQYPLFGTDLSNHVAYLGVERPHGGFEVIWLKRLNDWKTIPTSFRTVFIFFAVSRGTPSTTILPLS